MAHNRNSKRSSKRIEPNGGYQCTRPSQQVTVICKICNQEKVRTIRRAGGQPLYCDDCNNSTQRATVRKQRERAKKGQQLQRVTPTLDQNLLSQVSMQPDKITCHTPDALCDTLPAIPSVSESPWNEQRLINQYPAPLPSLQSCTEVQFVIIEHLYDLLTEPIPVSRPLSEVECHTTSQSCDTSPEIPDNKAIQAASYPNCLLPHPPIPTWTPDPSTVVPAKLKAIAQASFQQNCRVSHWQFSNQVIDAWFTVVREYLGKEYMDKECWGSPVPCIAMAKQMGVATVELVQWLIKAQPGLMNLSADGQFFSITDPMERFRAPNPPHDASNGAGISSDSTPHPESVITNPVTLS